jgi:hypothetical protein
MIGPSWERGLRTAGIVLVALTPVLWFATYLPPGTMTSVSMLALAAIGAGALGVLLIALSLVLRLRSRVCSRRTVGSTSQA